MDREEIVLKVIAKVSGVDLEKIAPESELVADLGIESPKALAMLAEIEDRLDTEIDDEMVSRLNTVADVLQAIRHRL